MAITQTKNQSITRSEVDFKGLLLALDPRVVDKAFVIDGRNFLVDVQGPHSAWMNRIGTYDVIGDPRANHTFRVGIDVFLCSNGCISRYNTLAGKWFPAYTFPDPGPYWPWSMATCGGNYFFCKKGVGVLMYEPDEQDWTVLTAAIPTDPRSVTQTFGRLIIVGQTITAWSALDDGTDFVPSNTTGAGFQGHTIINGVAEGLVCKQINDGMLIYTTHGVYIGQLAMLGNTPFRWLTINRSFVPLNPFCFADIDDVTHVILDEKGLYQTQDGNFTEFDPLMSEYLRTKIFPDHLLNGQIIANIRLTYSIPDKLFFIHIARDAVAPLYDMAYVKYTPKNEWGEFDHQHFFIGEISYSSGPSQGFNSGFCDAFGYFHNFISDIFSETAPSDDSLVLYNPVYDIPIRNQCSDLPSEVMIAASLVDIDTISKGPLYIQPTLTQGLYHVDPVTKQVSFYMPINSPLNSWVDIGLFRFTTTEFPDEISCVTNLQVGVDAIAGAPTIEDWELINSAGADIYEEWQVMPGREDWGENLTFATSFALKVIGLMDDKVSIFDQDLNPYLEADEGGAQFFTFQVNGLYIILEFSAMELAQTFHLKLIELGGFVAGRL